VFLRLHRPNIARRRDCQVKVIYPLLALVSRFLPQFGKHARSFFPGRVNKRAASPFALVHFDIWGPSRVVSCLGYRYFVTFIDDFSRCTWAYLNEKSFKSFLNI